MLKVKTITLQDDAGYDLQFEVHYEYFEAQHMGRDIAPVPASAEIIKVMYEGVDVYRIISESLMDKIYSEL